MNNSPHSSFPALKVIAALLCSASGVFAISALPGSFSFSTGNPDGKIATLSRLPSTGLIETETADDFVLTENTVIQQATFTGLIPSGAPLSSISRVEIEFYHVFPRDSANPPSGNVPTRINSPADVEIPHATSDSADGTLTFTSAVLNANFSVLNTVVNGINKSPNQMTGGEGPVSGQEIQITVTFNPAITLPPDHYFFRPAVQLSGGDFLWLSAPKPIVAPGTFFSADLQSWIRNDNLAPDWLRIGTDITGQGPFNAAFTLSGDLDADEDGVPDQLDQCPFTPGGEVVDAQGCSIDQLAPCAGPRTGGNWRNHNEYVTAVRNAAHEFLMEGLITRKERAVLVARAAQSTCGRHRP